MSIRREIRFGSSTLCTFDTVTRRLGKWLDAFVFAGRGIVVLLGEAHGRIHAVATVIVILLGLRLGISAQDWALLAICVALVLAAEAINTAVERLVDIVSPEWHPLARDAKDLAASAVLIAAIGAVAVGAIVFLPYM
jgi:diacylglycerol kinase